VKWVETRRHDENGRGSRQARKRENGAQWLACALEHDPIGIDLEEFVPRLASVLLMLWFSARASNTRQNLRSQIPPSTRTERALKDSGPTRVSILNTKEKIGLGH